MPYCQRGGLNTLGSEGAVDVETHNAFKVGIICQSSLFGVAEPRNYALSEEYSKNRHIPAEEEVN